MNPIDKAQVEKVPYERTGFVADAVLLEDVLKEELTDVRSLLAKAIILKNSQDFNNGNVYRIAINYCGEAMRDCQKVSLYLSLTGNADNRQVKKYFSICCELMGDCYSKLGNPEEAKIKYQDAMRFYEKMGEKTDLLNDKITDLSKAA